MRALKLLIEHLQAATIALLAAAGLLAAALGSAAAAAGLGIAIVLSYAWAAGRFSHLTAGRFTADPDRPWLEAEPRLVDSAYALKFVHPGDELTLRLSGAESKTRSILISLMHGRYRAAAHLSIPEDSPLAAAMKKAAFHAEVLDLREENSRARLRIRIAACDPRDDALIA